MDSHPDNIEVDKQTGDLWVASSYILHDIADVLEAYESNKTKAEAMIAPSQVIITFYIDLDKHLGVGA